MNPGDDWLEHARRLVAGLGQSLAAAAPADRADAADGPEPAAAHGSDCRWCPLCQAAAVLRGERPEVTAALADALGAAAAALRALAAEPGRPAEEPGRAEQPAGAEPAAAPGPQPGPETAGPVVQHIEIA
ncbi:hypothetical protein [Blastococcus sp. SYSU D00813]